VNFMLTLRTKELVRVFKEVEYSYYNRSLYDTGFDVYICKSTLLGGGTLGKGSVQEEIRFITSPELILAQLFTEEITDNEVVLMSGFETFSKFSGYAKSFKFAGRVCNPFASYKAQGLVKSIVAMDALMFRR